MINEIFAFKIFWILIFVLFWILIFESDHAFNDKSKFYLQI